jgi:FHS family glucose/mannose:H+ symporter-like MFS transporter
MFVLDSNRMLHIRASHGALPDPNESGDHFMSRPHLVRASPAASPGAHGSGSAAEDGVASGSVLRLTRYEAAAGFAIFMLLGALQAMYGPSIPSLRTDFHLSAPVAGLLLSAQFWGAGLGVIAFGASGRYVSTPWRLGIAMVSVVAGCGVLGLAVNWPMALLAALAIGFGSGALIVALNTVFATGFGQRSTAMVNLLNAAYGAGAVLGPVGVAVAPGNSFRAVFLTAGGVAILLVLPALRMPQGTSSETGVFWPQGRRVVSVLAVFLLIFLLYDGLEADIGGWAATQLKFNGFSGAAAANITALFWGALTLGRIILAPVTQRFAPHRLLTVQLLAVIVVMVLAHRSGLVPAAYTLTGFLLAPIFPVLFVWVQRTFPQVRSAASFVLLAALSGGAAFPPLVGKLIGASSPNVLPTVLLTIALAAVLAIQIVQRMARSIAPTPSGNHP